MEADHAHARRPADQPRGQPGLSARLDVQGDHLGGGAEQRQVHADPAADPGAHQLSFPNTTHTLSNFAGETCPGCGADHARRGTQGLLQHRVRWPRPEDRHQGDRAAGQGVRLRQVTVGPASGVAQPLRRRPPTRRCSPTPRSGSTATRSRRCRWRWSPPASPTTAGDEALPGAGHEGARRVRAQPRATQPFCSQAVTPQRRQRAHHDDGRRRRSPAAPARPPRSPASRSPAKTGTAENVPGQPTHAWFISFAPATEPEDRGRRPRRARRRRWAPLLPRSRGP